MSCCFGSLCGGGEGFASAVGIVLTIIVMSLQKMSNMITVWSEVKDWQKRAMQAAALAIAVAAFSFGRFLAVGIAMAVVAFPYRDLARLAGALRRRLGRGEDETPAKAGAAVPRREAPRRAGPVGSALLRGLKHATILAVLTSAMLPLYLMVIVSVKDNQQFYFAPATLTQPMHWENWQTAYGLITPALANSLVVSISSTFLTLFIALCAAYFFARFRMPLSGVLWNAILILMMMPTIANLIPLFRLLRDLNLLNTLTALVVVGASAGQIFAIFVLRSFVEDIPGDLFEAAEIDGANHFQQMRIIVLPLAGPILGTVGVMHFISQWNDFVMPLIIIRDHGRLPVMVQLLRMSGEYIKLWGPLMAGYALASIPIILLFVFTMKLFTTGLTEGAVKG